MLVLCRTINQRIRIGDDIFLTVNRIKGNSVHIGIEAPKDVRINRAELDTKPKDGTNRMTAQTKGREKMSSKLEESVIIYAELMEQYASLRSQQHDIGRRLGEASIVLQNLIVSSGAKQVIYDRMVYTVHDGLQVNHHDGVIVEKKRQTETVARVTGNCHTTSLD